MLYKSPLPPEATAAIEAVTEMGARKHGRGSWLNPDNPSLQRKANLASIHRHISKFEAGIELDEESGLDHRIHAAWRLLHSYVRDQRGIQDVAEQEAKSDRSSGKRRVRYVPGICFNTNLRCLPDGDSD